MNPTAKHSILLTLALGLALTVVPWHGVALDHDSRMQVAETLPLLATSGESRQGACDLVRDLLARSPSEHISTTGRTGGLRGSPIHRDSMLASNRASLYSPGVRLQI